MIPEPQFGAPIGPWRRAIAWLPVMSFDGEWLLGRVARRRIQKYSYLDGGADFWWQYARREEAGV